MAHFSPFFLCSGVRVDEYYEKRKKMNPLINRNEKLSQKLYTSLQQPNGIKKMHFDCFIYVYGQKITVM